MFAPVIKPQKKMSTTTNIKIEFTFERMVEVCLTLIEHGNAEGRAKAKEMIRDMGRRLDGQRNRLEAEIFSEMIYREHLQARDVEGYRQVKPMFGTSDNNLTGFSYVANSRADDTMVFTRYVNSKTDPMLFRKLVRLYFASDRNKQVA